MEDTFRFQDRRGSIRLKMICPAICTRFNNPGRECDQEISRSMNVSLKGVRLQSSFPVDSGEVLNITLALGANLVTFRGKVIYVTPSEGQGFELGISIEDIENQDRIALARFIYYFRGSVQRWDSYHSSSLIPVNDKGKPFVSRAPSQKQKGLRSYELQKFSQDR